VAYLQLGKLSAYSTYKACEFCSKKLVKNGQAQFLCQHCKKAFARPPS